LLRKRIVVESVVFNGYTRLLFVLFGVFEFICRDLRGVILRLKTNPGGLKLWDFFFISCLLKIRELIAS